MTLTTALALVTLTAVASPLDRAARLSHQLRTQAGPGLDTQFPPGVGAQFRELRHALRDAAAAELDLSPAEATARLERALKAAGLSPAPEAIPAVGEVSALSVDAVPGHPELRQVYASVAIGIGADDGAYLYQRRGMEWQLVLSAEGDPGDDAESCREGLQLKVSPADARGHWFAVAAWSIPWPSSCWNSLHFEALRPSAEPERPVQLGHERRGFYRCDPEPRLELGRDRFGVAYPAESEANATQMRARVERFRVEGDRLRHEPPTAPGPAELVSEWVGSPWELARQISAPDAALEVLHRQLEAPGEGEHDAFLEMGAVRACPGGRTMVNVQESPLEGRGRDRDLYFVVQQRAGAWLVLSATEQAPADCPAPPGEVDVPPERPIALPDPLR